MKFFIVIISLTTVISLGYLLAWWPDQYSHIVFCDVGQGDAILIKKGFTQILVDGGPDEKVLHCLSQNMPFWDRVLEGIVETHADADHLGGLPEVLEAYQVKNLFLNAYGKETDLFKRFRQKVIQEVEGGGKIVFPQVGEQIRIDEGIILTALFPDENAWRENIFKKDITEKQLSALLADQISFIKKINDRCIALLLEVGGMSILLPADLEENGEVALLEQGMLKDIDILKVGHHGSKTSSHSDLLRKVRPELAVIQLGRKNRYGHPHKEVIERFHHFSTKILRNDLLGTVEVITDGEEYWWKSEKSEEL